MRRSLILVLLSLLFAAAVTADSVPVAPITTAESTVTTLLREIQSVPHRVAAYLNQRSVDYQVYFSIDRDTTAWLNESWSLALVIGVPLLVWWGVHRLVVFLNRLRLRLLARRHASVAAVRMALVLQRGIPYLPWVVMLVLIAKGEPYLHQSLFADLVLLLPFVRYYLYYRIFRRLVEGIFNIISLLSSKGILAEIRERVQQSARTLGSYLFLALAFAYVVGAVVGQGVLYAWMQDGLLLGGVVILAYVAGQWLSDLIGVVRHILPDTIAEQLEKRCVGRARLLYSLPLLLLVLALLVYRLLRNWLGQFEFAKRLSAKLFLRKIESASTSTNTSTVALPEDYVAAFSLTVPEDDTLLIEPSHAQLDVLKTAFSQWAAGESTENTAAIYGNKGVGKSCLLRQVQIAAQDVTIVSCTIPAKLLSREAANTFFLEQLSQYVVADEDGRLIPHPSLTEKALILIDDAHNLFLSTPGGFDGYRVLVELLNTPSQHLFWCVALNRYAWTYLDAVFRRAEYFHVVMELARWTEADIRQMVLTRHAKTGYRLSYDDIIFAAGAMEDIHHAAHVESKFFRLLWEQSGGNPRIALYLWLSAVRPGVGKTLRVGLPKEIREDMFQSLSDDVLFVLAQVMRHENLSAEETVRTTSLPEGTVRHAIKIALENQLLERIGERYRVLTWAQPALIGFLGSRNFIYGH